MKYLRFQKTERMKACKSFTAIQYPVTPYKDEDHTELMGEGHMIYHAFNSSVNCSLWNPATNESLPSQYYHLVIDYENPMLVVVPGIHLVM